MRGTHRPPRRLRRSPASGRALPGRLDVALARAEHDLAALESRLAADESPEAGQEGLHRLMAVTSMVNLGLGHFMPSEATPDPALPDPGPTRSVPPTAAVTLPSAALSMFDPSATGLAGRLESIAASLHRLVALVASRIGATGYSIGVSLPAGLSITVEFRLPTAPGSPPG